MNFLIPHAEIAYHRLQFTIYYWQLGNKEVLGHVIIGLSGFQKIEYSEKKEVILDKSLIYGNKARWFAIQNGEGIQRFGT